MKRIRLIIIKITIDNTDFLMRPNIFMIFWVGDSDTHGKWRQRGKGGCVFVAFLGF